MPDKWAKFRDPRVNRSGEIQLKAVGYGTFGHFSNFDNSQPDVSGDVISDATSDLSVFMLSMQNLVIQG